jgi:hypothetical protein
VHLSVLAHPAAAAFDDDAAAGCVLVRDTPSAATLLVATAAALLESSCTVLWQTVTEFVRAWCRNTWRTTDGGAVRRARDRSLVGLAAYYRAQTPGSSIRWWPLLRVSVTRAARRAATCCLLAMLLPCLVRGYHRCGAGAPPQHVMRDARALAPAFPGVSMSITMDYRV